MKRITKEAAKDLGLRHYYTGKRCRNGKRAAEARATT